MTAVVDLRRAYAHLHRPPSVIYIYVIYIYVIYIYVIYMSQLFTVMCLS